VEGRRRSRRSLEAELMQQNSNTSASKDLPLDNATLQEILEQLMHHEDAWPFLKPVTKADAEDYYKIIKHPMDFGTVKHKLNMLEYSTNSEVLADALLIFENCYSYNKDDTEIYQCGVRLHQLLEKLCEERGLELCEEDRAPVAKKPRLTL